MSNMFPLNRRALLTRLGILAASLTLPVSPALSLEARLEALCRSAGADTEISMAGRLCYAHIQGASTADLIGALARECCGNHLVNELGAAAQRDFVQGKIVSVNGWRLSLTEARFYSLAYLIK